MPNSTETLRVSSVATKDRDNLRGILWMVVSVIGASIMTVAVRFVALELDSMHAVFYRSFIGVAFVALAIVIISPLRKQLSFTKPAQHIIRGVLITLATHFGFYTISTIPVATATVLFFTAPIFATLLSVFVHGEPIGMRRVLAMSAGFVGALVILRPGFGTFHFGMATALISSLCFSAALVMSRNLAQADGPLSAYISSAFIATVLTIPVIATDFKVPDLNVTWIFIILLVFASMTRSIADIQAYRHAEAGVLAPVAYLRLVFIGIAGFVVFGEIPDWATWFGAAIIISATLYMARREARLKASK